MADSYDYSRSFVTELLTPTITADASPSRIDVSGRYPIIPPIGLPVTDWLLFNKPTLCADFYRLRTCRTDPEIVSGLAFAFGIGDQRRDQLQYVLSLWI